MKLNKHLSLLCILGASGVAMFANPAMASHIPVEDRDITSGAGDPNEEVEVVLNDTDGDLKAIIDTTDIHMSRCRVYQWFTGMPYEAIGSETR